LATAGQEEGVASDGEDHARAGEDKTSEDEDEPVIRVRRSKRLELPLEVGNSSSSIKCPASMNLPVRLKDLDIFIIY